MPEALPKEVTLLLHADDETTRDAAWERFVAQHTRLILYVIRKLVRDRDRGMDAYAWVLERLREDGARRLRGYSANGAGKFTTWLVVVARRLTVDFLRHSGGRTQATGTATGDGVGRESQVFRRRLLALAGDTVDLDALRDEHPAADDLLDRSERLEALTQAVQELPSMDRLLLTLRFDDGLQAEQIARTMHFPTRFHVYRRLDRVLTQLRTQLNGRGIDGDE